LKCSFHVFAANVTINGVPYQWGGTYCSRFTPLTDGQAAILFQARLSGFTVAPFYETGTGTTKCLVAFVVL
jgi:hypothetical protein